MSRKISKTVNEFNQQLKPISLWADAWKRLRRNRMALVSLWIVGFYAIIALAAPILPFFDYRTQNLNQTNLPPSFRPAGQLVIEKLESDKIVLEERVASGMDALKPDLERVTREIVVAHDELTSNPDNRKVYILGTDNLGRDVLAKSSTEPASPCSSASSAP